MENYKVLQLQPNHADHISYYKEKYLDDMFTREMVIAQPKYDGERMLIHINNGEVYCTSRRYSKKTGRFMENQDKLPILQEVFKNFDLDYTVLDCECYSKDWSTIVGILHSLPERAIELSKINVPHFAVFDCIWYNGQDMRDNYYGDRLKLAAEVVNKVNYEPLHMVASMQDDPKIGWTVNQKWYRFSFIKSKEDWQTAMQKALDAGFEGIVVKSLARKYYDKGASLKCKKFETVDCVVYDYQQGTGKYADTVGALKIGYYDPDTDSIIGISKVNCSTDEERNRWRDEWETRKNSVIEVKCQEITERSLRHPVYIRRREDKDKTMCTKETIFKE